MRIAIVGAGNVGRAVGRAWTETGHRVRYGVRDPARVTDLPNVARVAEAVADVFARSTCPKVNMLLLRRYPMMVGSDTR